MNLNWLNFIKKYYQFVIGYLVVNTLTVLGLFLAMAGLFINYIEPSLSYNETFSIVSFFLVVFTVLIWISSFYIARKHHGTKFSVVFLLLSPGFIFLCYVILSMTTAVIQ